MQRFIQALIPFIILGIGIIAFAFGIILLAYLFFFGAILGLFLFLVKWIQTKFFQPKVSMTPYKKKTGRTINSDDWNRLD